MKNSFKLLKKLNRYIEERCPICSDGVKEENVMGKQTEWWIRAYQKLFENLLSVKVWILGGGLLVSSVVVFKFSQIEGVKPDTLVDLFSDWCAYNGGVVTAVLGLREAFKVAKIKNGNNGDEEAKKKIDNVMV